MDGTFIGDTTLELCRYELCRSLNMKYVHTDIDYRIKNGLSRPYFESFIKTMKLKYPFSEFYIYTAAEGSWASLMIKNVEQALDIKFNRPIFHRKYCIKHENELKKSLSRVIPIIFKGLKKSYPSLIDKNDLHKNTVLIDNNYIVTSIDSERLIKCPTYSYLHVYDPLSGIAISKLEKHFEKVFKILSGYGLITKQENNIQGLLSQYHNNLSFLYQKTSTKNIIEEDKFWYIIERIFRNHRIQSLNKKVISYLQKSVIKYKNGGFNIYT